MLRTGDKRLYELDPKRILRGWPWRMTVKDGRVLIHRGKILLVDTALTTIEVREPPKVVDNRESRG